MPTPDRGDDFLGRGSAEGTPIVIGLVDVSVDGCLERYKRVAHAAFEPLLSQLDKEAFVGVEPGDEGRGEMGLDFSKTSDLTTLVLVARDNEGHWHVKPTFLLPATA